MRLKNYDILEGVALILIVGAVFLFNIGTVRFVSDESMWISRSYYFELYFSGRFRDIVHDPSPSIAMAMPTVPQYLIGFSRWVGGYRPQDLNQNYSFEESYQQNVAEGKVPSPRLLWWSRLLPSLMGAASILLAFYLIKAARNRLAGYLWLLVSLANGYLTSSLQVAMSEAPLILCLVLACFAGYQALNSAQAQPSGRRQTVLWMALFGAFTGLAGQSKNNGLAIFFAGIVILAVLALRAGPALVFRLKFAGSGFLGMSAATFLFFVGPNPLLWKHPIRTSLALIPFRIGLMDRQLITYPQSAIHGWQGWLQAVPGQIFGDLTPMHFWGSPYLKLMIASLGLWVLAAQAWRLARAGKLDAAALSILTTGAIASIPPLFTPLNWARYLIIPAFFVSILLAIGAEFILGQIWERWKGRASAPERAAA